MPKSQRVVKALEALYSCLSWIVHVLDLLSRPLKDVVYQRLILQVRKGDHMKRYLYTR